jgi:acyl dehydratase
VTGLEPALTRPAVVWEINAAAHLAFTELSADVNPIHTDPLVARRSPFGQVVVHGVHLLARALDQWAASHPDRAFTHVSATFRHPVAVGDALTTEWTDLDNQSAVGMSVDVKGVRAVDITAQTTTHRVAFLGEWRPESRRGWFGRPSIRTIEELFDHRGSVPVDVDIEAATSSFPHLTGAASRAATVELITLSTLVGMHAPGLHSMFSSLDVAVEQQQDLQAGQLNYSVTRVDHRFSRITIDVESGAITGQVVAFVRPAPIAQTIDTSAVHQAEFAGEQWLIVGGSRGLGAAAVRLLTAGGADVRFTYHQGLAESVQLGIETGAVPARLDVFAGDVVRQIVDFADGWQPTHLGWFASPPIFVGARDTYDNALHQRFVSAYVDAFAQVIDAHAPRGLVGALWPSSEAVGVIVPGLAEYSDAKRLGERRCEELRRQWPGVTIAAPRLPRLLTDQSTTFVPTEFGDTATEVLAALRATRSER